MSLIPTERLTEEELREAFAESGAYLTGHFVLSSGRHSATYVEKFAAIQKPELMTRMCGEIARRFAGASVQTVVGPLTGGMVLAYDVARYLGVRFIFTEREAGEMTFRRGFTVAPGERVLVVEDVVTTGGSVQEVLGVLRGLGAEILGVASLVDRSGGTADFGCRFESLLHVQAESYAPEECPLCKQGVPITKRGSRGLGAGR